jgi:hypothetical protein
MMLSPHFSLEELTATQHRGIDNTPPASVVENLRVLANDTLELVRMLLGPVHINSGYRSPALNVAVGGQPNSQHCDGLAADFIVPRFSLQDATRRILAQRISFDQLIYEFGAWIHISHPPVGRLGRGDALMVGSWTGSRYLTLDLAGVPS